MFRSSFTAGAMARMNASIVPQLLRLHCEVTIIFLSLWSLPMKPYIIEEEYCVLLDCENFWNSNRGLVRPALALAGTARFLLGQSWIDLLVG